MDIDSGLMGGSRSCCDGKNSRNSSWAAVANSAHSVQSFLRGCEQSVSINTDKLTCIGFWVDRIQDPIAVERWETLLEVKRVLV